MKDRVIKKKNAEKNKRKKLIILLVIAAIIFLIVILFWRDKAQNEDVYMVEIVGEPEGNEIISTIMVGVENRTIESKIPTNFTIIGSANKNISIIIQKKAEYGVVIVKLKKNSQTIDSGVILDSYGATRVDSY